MFFELFFNMQKIKGSELVSDACRRSVLVSLLINVSTLLNIPDKVYNDSGLKCTIKKRD